MEGPRCQFCRSPIALDATRCPFCGGRALPPPAAELHVPAEPSPPGTRLVPAGMLGALLICLGSVLPWYVEIGMIHGRFRDYALLGVQTTGRFTLLLGLAIGLFSVLVVPNRRWLRVSCAGATLLLGLYSLVTLQQLTGVFADRFAREGTGVGGASLGVGLYLVLAGATLALLGALRGAKA